MSFDYVDALGDVHVLPDARPRRSDYLNALGSTGYATGPRSPSTRCKSVHDGLSVAVDVRHAAARVPESRRELLIVLMARKNGEDLRAAPTRAMTIPPYKAATESLAPNEPLFLQLVKAVAVSDQLCTANVRRMQEPHLVASDDDEDGGGPALKAHVARTATHGARRPRDPTPCKRRPRCAGHMASSQPSAPTRRPLRL